MKQTLQGMIQPLFEDKRMNQRSQKGKYAIVAHMLSMVFMLMIFSKYQFIMYYVYFHLLYIARKYTFNGKMLYFKILFDFPKITDEQQLSINVAGGVIEASENWYFQRCH